MSLYVPVFFDTSSLSDNLGYKQIIHHAERIMLALPQIETKPVQKLQKVNPSVRAAVRIIARSLVTFELPALKRVTQLADHDSTMTISMN